MEQSNSIQKQKITRRTFIQTAGAGIAAAASSFAWASPNPSAEACILIWLSGGISQLDTFDPKPFASAEIRGPFQPRNSSIQGVQVCEPLPRIAELLEYTTLIRTLSSDETNHDRAAHYLLTGSRPTGSTFFPTVSSQISRSHSPANRISSEVIIATQPNGSGIKFISKLYSRASESKISPFIEPISEYENAPAVYGNTPLGKACFQALRTIEKGNRCVTVVDEGWDLHDELHDQYKAQKLPELDRAFSALWNDLQRYGWLQRTLIVILGEFGRSPKINAFGGRDHWPQTGCVLLAGGPMQRGEVIGQTDEWGAKPVANPISPSDLGGIILTAMGSCRDESYLM